MFYCLRTILQYRLDRKCADLCSRDAPFFFLLQRLPCKLHTDHRPMTCQLWIDDTFFFSRRWKFFSTEVFYLPLVHGRNQFCFVVFSGVVLFPNFPFEFSLLRARIVQFPLEFWREEIVFLKNFVRFDNDVWDVLYLYHVLQLAAFFF